MKANFLSKKRCVVRETLPPKTPVPASEWLIAVGEEPVFIP